MINYLKVFTDKTFVITVIGLYLKHHKVFFTELCTLGIEERDLEWEKISIGASLCVSSKFNRHKGRYNKKSQTLQEWIKEHHRR